MDDITETDTATPEHHAEVPLYVTPPEPQPVTLHSVQQHARTLPRYSHTLLSQSMVGSTMQDDPEGEWVKRDDVLRLFGG